DRRRGHLRHRTAAAGGAETGCAIKSPVAALHQATLREAASSRSGGRTGKVHQGGYYPVGHHFKHRPEPKNVGLNVRGPIKIPVAALDQPTSRIAASAVTGHST